MPISPAHARKLLQQSKAQRIPHHAFTVIRLGKAIAAPALRPVVLGIAIHQQTAELFLLADGKQEALPLMHILVDLQSTISQQLRRRAGHRRRRRARQRYHAPSRYGIPFKLRRPSMARSAWRARFQRRLDAKHSELKFPPVIRWRVQALQRTINKLAELAPISHIVLLGPYKSTEPVPAQLTPAALKRRLIALYGVPGQGDKRVAACGYCGTTDGRIVVDHIEPKDQGGTDTWDNLTLACRSCNNRKGNRTPAEAGMTLRKQARRGRPSTQKTHPYLWQTALLLINIMRRPGLSTCWLGPHGGDLPLRHELYQQLTSFARQHAKLAPSFIAKPISRPRKQRFTARNYPLSTPLEPPFTRVGQTVKRQTRINRGLALLKQHGKVTSKVLPLADGPEQPEGQVISIGMLCESQRAGNPVVGIVQAIHSTGRITLVAPAQSSPAGVRWKRVVISPRTRFVVRSTEKVIFLPTVSEG